VARPRAHRASVPFPLYPYYRVCLPSARTLDPVLDRFGPDIVHVVTPSLLGLYGVRYARRRGIPVVASFHTDFVRLFRYYGLRSLERLGTTWRGASTANAPSPWPRHAIRRQAARTRQSTSGFVAAGREPGVVLAGVPQPRAARPARRGGRPILLYVGRLGREKNLHYLAQAMRLLARQGDRFKLVIVGQGPMRRALAARLPEAVFTGPSKGRSCPAGTPAPTCSCSPPSPKRSGTWCSRRFASGLPVIGVDAGSVRELVSPNWNGRLAPADSPAAFADAIQSLLHRPAELARLGFGARVTAAQYRWPDVIANCWSSMNG